MLCLLEGVLRPLEGCADESFSLDELPFREAGKSEATVPGGEWEFALELTSEDAEVDGVLFTLGANTPVERKISLSLRINMASLDLERRTVCFPSAFSMPGVDALRPLGSGVCGSVARPCNAP